MSDTPNGGAGGWARLAQLVKNHPLLAVASALGSIGTFAAGTAGVAGLFMGGEVVTDQPPPPAVAESYEYREISDYSGQITVEAPTVWRNTPGNGWHALDVPGVPDNTVLGPGVNAAPNVQAWKTDLETPGIFVGASRKILRRAQPEDVLGAISFSGECRSTASETYADARFTGEIVTWSCPGAVWRVLAATPTRTRDYLLYVQAKIVTTADEEAYNKALNTFEVDFDP